MHHLVPNPNSGQTLRRTPQNTHSDRTSRSAALSSHVGSCRVRSSQSRQTLLSSRYVFNRRSSTAESFELTLSSFLSFFPFLFLSFQAPFFLLLPSPTPSTTAETACHLLLQVLESSLPSSNLLLLPPPRLRSVSQVLISLTSATDLNPTLLTPLEVGTDTATMAQEVPLLLQFSSTQTSTEPSTTITLEEEVPNRRRRRPPPTKEVPSLEIRNELGLLLELEEG